MNVKIKVEMKNDYGEVESQTIVCAGNYPAAAKKARRWLKGAGVDNPTHIYKSDATPNQALWVYESKPGVTP